MSDKRIMKNTIILYLRMIFQMGVYLYTTRVVIEALGLLDYGIYDVVGSVVVAMMFLNNSMLNCTQRFITYTLAENNREKLNQIFSHSIMIHVVFGVLIVLLGSLLGTIYIQEYMNIPQDRIQDALFVFYISLASAFVTIVSVPYNALIVAKEHMGAFAAITIVDVLLKLLVATLLLLFDDNRLRMYALLLFAASLVVRLIYGIYCRVAYKEIRFIMKPDKKVLKSMLGFLGWNTIGNTAIMCNTQGLNLLLNTFGGALVNAARGIAFQVQTATVSFINSFQTAINPQITKNYATGNFERMNSLVLTSSRVSFLLMLFIIVPLLLLTENLLELWLGCYPPYAVLFVRLLIGVSVVDAISNPLMVGASATGNIKKYQLLVGGCMLCTLPISFVALRQGASPQAVFWALLATTIMAQIVRMWLCRNLFKFSIRNFCSQVLSPILKVAVACFIPLLLLRSSYAGCGGIDIIFTALALDLWVVPCIYLLGLTRNEREFLSKKIKLIMKQLFAKLIRVISLPLGFIWNAKVSAMFNSVVNRIYSRILEHRFTGAKGLRVFGRPVIVTGGRFIKAGKNVEICRYARIDAISGFPNTGQTFTPQLELGDNVVIQISCHIGCINKVKIGDYTTIGARTYITDHTHGTVELEDLKLPPRHRKLYSKGPVIIGKYVSIGEGCAIMPGVTIGDNVVIGANSVVTKDIPSFCVACGNPARVIRNQLDKK